MPYLTDGGSHVHQAAGAERTSSRPAVEVLDAADARSPPTQSFPIGYVGVVQLSFGHTDGHYYAIVKTLHTEYDRADVQLRLPDSEPTTLDDPSSWRAWDGSGLQSADGEPLRDRRARIRVSVSLSQMTNYASLSYSTYLDRYVRARQRRHPHRRSASLRHIPPPAVVRPDPLEPGRRSLLKLQPEGSPG